MYHSRSDQWFVPLSSEFQFPPHAERAVHTDELEEKLLSLAPCQNKQKQLYVSAIYARLSKQKRKQLQILRIRISHEFVHMLSVNIYLSSSADNSSNGGTPNWESLTWALSVGWKSHGYSFRTWSRPRSMSPPLSPHTERWKTEQTWNSACTMTRLLKCQSKHASLCVMAVKSNIGVISMWKVWLNVASFTVCLGIKPVIAECTVPCATFPAPLGESLHLSETGSRQGRTEIDTAAWLPSPQDEARTVSALSAAVDLPEIETAQ